MDFFTLSLVLFIPDFLFSLSSVISSQAILFINFLIFPIFILFCTALLLQHFKWIKLRSSSRDVFWKKLIKIYKIWIFNPFFNGKKPEWKKTYEQEKKFWRKSFTSTLLALSTHSIICYTFQVACSWQLWLFAFILRCIMKRKGKKIAVNSKKIETTNNELRLQT